MKLLDVNVLLYAFREELPHHAKAMRVLRDTLNSSEACAVSDLILAGFLRLACHPKTFKPPASVSRAVAFINAIRSAPNVIVIAPGPDHWETFLKLLSAPGLTGGDVWDAYLAALAIDADAVWLSFDQGFKRFVGLRWTNLLNS